MELLNITETMKTVGTLTGKDPNACEKVVAAAVDVLHTEVERRSTKDPTLYGSIQDGTYCLDVGEHLEPSNFLPGDWWTQVCRRSKTNFPDAEKVIASFRDLWLASNKFFEPLGTISVNGVPADNIWHSLSLRRDFIGPSVTFEDEPHPVTTSGEDG